jgi:hypothetical protein
MMALAVAAITVVRPIRAPVAVVYETIVDPRRFADAISGVTKLEILSANTSGAGTRFRQSRTMNGRENTMEFDVIESVPNECVRIVNETHGTVWDSVFRVAPSNGHAVLTMRMETRSRRLYQRLLMPLIMLMIRKAVEKDMDAVTAYFENVSGTTVPPRGQQ